MAIQKTITEIKRIGDIFEKEIDDRKRQSFVKKVIECGHESPLEYESAMGNQKFSQ